MPRAALAPSLFAAATCFTYEGLILACRTAAESQWAGAGQGSTAGQRSATALHQQPVQVARSTRRCAAGNSSAAVMQEHGVNKMV
jgi:hypothetical protein